MSTLHECFQTTLAPSVSPESLPPVDDAIDEGMDLEEFIARDPLLAVAMDELARRQYIFEALAAQRLAETVGRAVRTENCWSADGLGAPVRMMPAFAYHDIAHQMGSYECFSDKSFNRYLDRKAPETKVKPLGTKVQVGWREHSQIEVPFARMTEPRFSKRYGSLDPIPQTPSPIPCSP